MKERESEKRSGEQKVRGTKREKSVREREGGRKGGREEGGRRKREAEHVFFRRGCENLGG